VKSVLDCVLLLGPNDFPIDFSVVRLRPQVVGVLRIPTQFEADEVILLIAARVR
jgi:hypothetical protein